MDAWLNALESIDNQWLPPLLLVAGLLLTLYFIYSALNGRGAGRRREVNIMNRESNDSILSSTQSLHEQWTARPDYSNVLRNGVQSGGTLKGWFVVEGKICSEFKNKIAGIGAGIDDYPATEIEYLQIVSEIDRAPKPWWVWALLVVLIAAEAYGFSIVLAGILNDYGSAAQDTYLATGLAYIFAMVALFAAVFVGEQAYKQAYARRVWKDSFPQIRLEVDGPGNTSVAANKTLAANTKDNEADKGQRQATRMANRSKYVQARAAETRGTSDNNKVPPFTIWFWIYVAAVFVIAFAMLTVRIMAIDQSQERELQRLQAAAAEVVVPEEAAGNVKPNVVTEQNIAASTAVTQESLEQTRRTKIVATSVYMLLFWFVQAIAVLFTARYGFASDGGKGAYKKIRAFRSRHGAVLEEDYKARVDERVVNARNEATALASATLKNWQLGLQTEYRNGNTGLNESERRVIEEALNGSSHRTYERYVALTEAPAHAQSMASTPAQVFESTTAAPTVVARAGGQELRCDTDIEVEFYQRGSSGEEVVQVGVLQQLKAGVAEAELDAASLMVRVAGQPGRYMSYREFLQATRGTLA